MAMTYCHTCQIVVDLDYEDMERDRKGLHDICQTCYETEQADIAAEETALERIQARLE